ncbi:S1C family serine protease [Alkalibacillus almallahensis]|uniref:S1C family serine protease n=1 Tax=Alkalibacillus almallahensis TaxID=1379154 RepID=UPI00142020FC|nr:trypsin-like peptidase domain-containing protein [Alkalibacillus almallahensis]NIK13256.1 hypothetical protein [Alkalibacillus almallahensis]
MKYQLLKNIPLVLSVAIIIIGTIAMLSYYNNWEQTSLASQENLVETVAQEENTSSNNLQEIIHEAQKNVVQIETTGPEGSSQGSGFVYNEKGDIITNAHVVKDADSVYVKTSEAQTYPAGVIGIGNQQDIAVVRVPQLANSATLEVDPNFEPNIGDEIIAVGSPHGLRNTVTLGHISGLDRDMTVEQYQYNNLYQISANISQGNSGGPLIHEETGKIIGINSAATNEGTIGFSIPIAQIFDRVSMWSDTASEEDLNYDGDPTMYQDISPGTLEEDGLYLIDYFYETLNVRDYFAAYSLLGSDLQTSQDYQEFRESVVNSIEIDVTNREVTNIGDYKATIVVNSDHLVTDDDENEETYHYETTFEVGQENDQLKILSMNREILSRTNETSGE